MFVHYDQMPSDSRVWVYHADRTLSEEEVSYIKSVASEFLDKWSAHGEGLKSSADVKYHRFLVILLDESHAASSGCSIDASVHFVQNLESKLDVNFLDRTLIPFMANGSVETERMNEIQNKVDEGKILPETITFNNLVKNKRELEANWMVPAASTWLGKYF